jgi:hypothetical protein
MTNPSAADRPFAPFDAIPMAPLSERISQTLQVGAQPFARFTPLAQTAALLQESPAGLEDGYGFDADGTLAIAVRTELPRVTPAMIDWWFGWHGDDPARYRLWHPQAHVSATWDRAGRPGAVGRECWEGRTSNVVEWVGGKLERVRVSFASPTEPAFGCVPVPDVARATLVCARIELHSRVRAGWLVHAVRVVPGGSEMRSRFWLGGRAAQVTLGPLSGPVSALARRLRQPTEAQAQALLQHCAEEMTHLAKVLPGLYGRFGADPRG